MSSTSSPISIRTSGERDYAAMPDAEVMIAARNREATARFAWSPYMHNPEAQAPAAPHPHSDPVPVGRERPHPVASRTGAPFATPIPGARFELIERAGHFPHLEQPEEFARRVLAFAGKHAAALTHLRRSLNAMKVFHFTEQPYFPSLGGSRGLAARQPAEPQARSQDRGRPAPSLLRRVAAVRRARPRHHDQRAPSDRDLHVLGRDRAALDPGAADQARAPAGARLSDRPPARSAAWPPRSSRPST